MIREILPLLLCCTAPLLRAQDVRSTLQVHGFVAEGVLYSTYNNYLEAQTSDGDASWVEAVASVTDNPARKLRVGLQLHYIHLGALSDTGPHIDWAEADYRINPYFGVRGGKVKTPLGLFNDTQDLDTVFLWSLLPQCTYQVENRSFLLAHLGGELYGSVPLGEKHGKLSYRTYGGSNSLAQNAGFVEQIREYLPSLHFKEDPSGPMAGTDLRWQTAWRPLMVGVSVFEQHLTGEGDIASYKVRALVPAYYAQWDHGKFYFAGEYRRQLTHTNILIGPYLTTSVNDQRQWYVMTSYHATAKLQVGTYYSRDGAGLPGFWQKNNSRDFVQSARYDFNENVYAKVENHFLHGTALGFYSLDNTSVLKPRTDLVIGKVGFTF